MELFISSLDDALTSIIPTEPHCNLLGAGRVFVALKPAFGEHGLPVERLSGADMRQLLKLPGMAAHPAVARALAASLDSGPAWPQVLFF